MMTNCLNYLNSKLSEEQKRDDLITKIFNFFKKKKNIINKYLI